MIEKGWQDKDKIGMDVVKYQRLTINWQVLWRLAHYRLRIGG